MATKKKLIDNAEMSDQFIEEIFGKLRTIENNSQKYFIYNCKVTKLKKAVAVENRDLKEYQLKIQK